MSRLKTPRAQRTPKITQHQRLVLKEFQEATKTMRKRYRIWRDLWPAAPRGEQCPVGCGCTDDSSDDGRDAVRSQNVRDRDGFFQAYREWEGEISRAVCAGLQDHPLVRPLVSSYLDQLRREGSREVLARFRTKKRRLGLNRNAPLPRTTLELEIYNAIVQAIDEGLTWKAMQERLTRENLVDSRMTSQAFHKLVDRVGRDHAFVIAMNGVTDNAIAQNVLMNVLRDCMAAKRPRQRRRAIPTE